MASSRMRLALAAGVLAGLLAMSATALAQEEGVEAELQAAQPQTRAAKAGTTVSMRNLKFVPRNITVDAGDRVTWENDESDPTVVHTATQTGGGFNTRRLDPGERASKRFDDAGTFKYYCKLHANMKGKVEVLAASTGSADDGAAAAAAAAPSATTDVYPADGSATTSSPGQSSGPLPSTGGSELWLFIAAAGVLALGLLVGAAAAWFSEYAD